ncbi:MAG: hypothetical protein M0D54_13780 [Hyphomonadaceae bacterium JAD_PAG50586_4]|nr:MAG: hypothetical protein M0D54_13780 [Hyphomonadaceae bacterium JAD_PAG50586_4]
MRIFVAFLLALSLFAHSATAMSVAANSCAVMESCLLEALDVDGETIALDSENETETKSDVFVHPPRQASLDPIRLVNCAWGMRDVALCAADLSTPTEPPRLFL